MADILALAKAERVRLMDCVKALDKLIAAYEPAPEPRPRQTKSWDQWNVLDESFDEEEICR